MYAPIHSIANFQSMSGWFTPDTVQRFPLNMKIDCMDPYWGYGEFVYGKAAAALNVWNLVCAQPTFGSYDKVPNTANQGFPVYVATNEFAINTFGWFQKSGLTVVKSNATVAAAASVGITAAGVIGAFAAGKQIVGYTQLQSQTATKVFTNVQTLSGSSKLIFPNGYDGIFLGGALTGTGIPASTVAAKLDPDGLTVYTGSAVGTTGDKNSTATGAVSVTQTNTGYSVAHVESPFAQGQIT